uniref:ODAD1 central coiled coil region domain-containing protein n=1 Tax=Fabrea salina TaxID=342563 RepID=A0A7S3MRA6_9CILI|mmetsp:Transcript_2114/g.3379  ORF Transcript_2114/g.3379 Transcript_2114/m.3379 type:complete len:461 (+) Transcript_2114:1-1383(+)
MASTFRKSNLEKSQVIAEAEAQRLERDTENFTVKLEHERRTSNLLDKELEELKQKCEDKKQKIRNLQTKNKELKADQKITMVETQLEAAEKRLSDFKTQNNNLREQIDSIRIQNKNSTKDNLKVSDEISRTRSQLSLTNEDVSKLKKSQELTQTNLHKTQKSLIETREMFSERISTLTSKILEDKLQGTKFVKGITVKYAEPIANASELLQLNKNAAENWMRKCKELQEKISSHRSFVEQLRKAMSTMQEQSSLSTYEEVVSSFIKSFEENLRLNNYICEVAEEISSIEEEIAKNTQQIKDFKNFKDESEDSKQQKLQSKRESLETVKQKRTAAIQKTASIKQAFECIQVNIKSISELLSNFKFNSEFFKKELNFESTEVYLNQIEELLEAFLQWNNSLENKPQVNMTKELPPLKHPRVKAPDVIYETHSDEESYPLSSKEIRDKAMKVLNKNYSVQQLN